MPTGLPAPTAAETTLHQYDANRWYPRHAEIIDRLEAIRASTDAVTAAINAQTTAIVNAVNGLQGAENRTMTDIWNKIDSSAVDLTQVEANLGSIDNLLGILTSSTDDPAYAQINDLADLLKILMNPATHTDYFNLHELRVAITGQTFVDGVEAESYAPTIEGIIKKLTNLQGTPTGSRQGLVDNRTDLRNILDALSGPPVVGTEDPTNWWDELLGLIDGVSDVLDIWDFFRKQVATAAQAATAGTTGATAIGQWITAMALAIIAMQNNSAQLTRLDIRNNSDDMNLYLDALTARNGSVDPDRIGLYDVREDMSNIRDQIRSDLGTIQLWIQTNAGNTANILTLITALRPHITCICVWLKKIEDNTSEVVFGAKGGITTSPALTTTAPVSDHCQRSFWFMDQMIGVIKVFEAMDRAITEEMVRLAFLKNFYDGSKGFNVPISDQYARSIARYCKYVKEANDGADFAGIISVLEIDTATHNALQNSIFSAASASAAQTAWESTALNIIGDTSSGYSFLNAEEKRLIASLVFPELLNALFKGEIPRDSADLSGYSNDCSGLSGSPSGSIPPGGWEHTTCYNGVDGYPGDEHPSDPTIVPFWGDRFTKSATLFTNYWVMPDRWTITTNLKGWKFIGLVKYNSQTRYIVECYDNGVLIANSPASGGGQIEITVDTSSVQFKLTEGEFTGAVCIHAPSSDSGWPFAGS